MANLSPAFLYFDLGNVLLNFDHRVACRQMAEVAGVTPEKVWQVLFTGNLEWGYERGELSSQQFYEAFCRCTGSRPDFEQLLLAASDIFELNVDVVPIVASLKGAGYRLGILSNTCEAHWQFVGQGRYVLLKHCFEVFALSFRLGAMKPEPVIYRTAAEMAGVAAQEIFYVDDREENVHGACDAGFDAVLYTSALQLAADLRARQVRFNY